MSSFAFSPIRGRPKKSGETSEETKAPVRKGSPIPTATEQYGMYAGDPQHPFNLKKDTIDKIFNNCDMMKEDQRKKNVTKVLNDDFVQLMKDHLFSVGYLTDDW